MTESYRVYENQKLERQYILNCRETRIPLIMMLLASLVVIFFFPVNSLAAADNGWQYLQAAVNGNAYTSLWDDYFSVDDSTSGTRVIKLKQDIVCQDQSLGPIQIGSTKSITIDLNSQKIDRGLYGKDPIGSGQVMTVNGGKLYITDTSTDKLGEICGGNSKNGNSVTSNGGLFVYNYSTVVMDAGKITRNAITGGMAYGGGVHLASGSSFTLKGTASICYNSLYGTYYEGNFGAGVNVGSNSFFTMSEQASIHDNTADGKNANVSGGGLTVNTNGTFTMDGGSIYGNTVNTNSTKYNCMGAGFYINGKGKATIN